ncbi:MAG: histidinol-phosphate transaminase, partial [Myxococcaceae bacterium]|nr:histidinol-phosphate transaminase [Myxococcaceae bacterium]
LNLYPDGSSYYLVRALARHLGFPPEQIFVGSGSNEIIELLIRTFVTPEDEVLLTKGSFVMYKVALQAHGRPFVEVPMKAGYRYDLEAMAKAMTPRTRLVFLANPDNPTGTAFGKSELDAFLQKVPPDVLVVHDEAYFEYCDLPDYPNGLDYVRRYPNMIAMRTFAKAYGLAGVRLGYAVMDAKLVGYLNRTRMPFHLTSLAQAAGVAALEDQEHVRKTVALAHEGLRYLEAELPRLGVEVPRSYANFVFADFKRPAKPIYEGLLRKGVITRPVPNYGFPNALRISVGLPDHNERLVRALKELLA